MIELMAFKAIEMSQNKLYGIFFKTKKNKIYNLQKIC